MVLKPKLAKKLLGGPKASKVGGPINKAHLSKGKKSKKLRQAITTAHQTQNEQPEDQEHEEIQENTQDEELETQVDTPQQITEQTDRSTKKNKRKLQEDKPQHKSASKSAKLEQKIPLKDKKSHAENKQSPTNTPKEPQQKRQKQQEEPPKNNEDNTEEDAQNILHSKIKKAGEYYVLPFKFAKKGSVVRQLLVKHDTINNVLRIVNLSIGVDEAALTGIFQFFSPTKVTITREDNIPDAIVACGKKANMEAFCKTLSLPIVLKNNHIVPLDRKTGKNQEKKKSAADLQKEIDSFMHDYDAGVIENHAAAQNLGKDADGFKLAGVRSNLVRAEHGSKREKTLEQLQQKEKAKQLTNFYKFQKTEQFKAEQAALNKKLASEKSRIAQMAQQRKFKPF